MQITKILIPIIFFVSILTILLIKTEKNFPSFEGFPSFGNPKASVHMVVFEDLDCESCHYFNRQVFPFLQKHYIEKGTLMVTIVVIDPEEKNTAQVQALYCLSGDPNQFFYYLNNNDITQAMSCDKEESLALIAKAKKLELRYMPKVIETPYILINNEKIENLSLSAITKRIEECLN